jgi:hypothetical protein
MVNRKKQISLQNIQGPVQTTRQQKSILWVWHQQRALQSTKRHCLRRWHFAGGDSSYVVENCPCVRSLQCSDCSLCLSKNRVSVWSLYRKPSDVGRDLCEKQILVHKIHTVLDEYVAFRGDCHIDWVSNVLGLEGLGCFQIQ